MFFKLQLSLSEASKATFQRLTAVGRLQLTHVTSRVALSPLWPDRICPAGDLAPRHTELFFILSQFSNGRH